MMAVNMALRTPMGLRALFPRSTLSHSHFLSSLRRSPTIRLAANRTSLVPKSTIIQQPFRRCYADAPAVRLSPTPKPKKRFRFLRWTWRLIYVSALAYAGYIFYVVYDMKHPGEQFAPDPSKKTLVILGRSPKYLNICSRLT